MTTYEEAHKQPFEDVSEIDPESIINMRYCDAITEELQKNNQDWKPNPDPMIDDFGGYIAWKIEQDKKAGRDTRAD